MSPPDSTPPLDADPDPSDPVERHVAELLATPVPSPPDEVRDRQIARAMEAFEGPTVAGVQAAPSGDGSTPGNDEGASVVALPTHRRRRWLGVAAAVVVAVTAVTLVVGHLRSTPANHLRQASGSAATDNHATTATGSSGTTGPSGASAAPADVPDLGTARDADQLSGLVRTFERSATSSLPSSVQPQLNQGTQGPLAASASDGGSFAAAAVDCTASARRALGLPGPLTLRATATLAGRAVDVLVFGAGQGQAASRLVAVTPGTCHVLVDRAG